MHANNPEKRPERQIDITQEQLALIGGPKMVYVKEMGAAEIAGIEKMEEVGKLPDGIKLYAVHLMDGTRIAVVDNRDAAFAAARQNEMEPVSVH
jgi:hypothetical protein